MNKKHGFLFGFAVIAIAAMVTFTGCPTEAGDDPLLWPAGFTYKEDGTGDWVNSESSGTLISFGTLEGGGGQLMRSGSQLFLQSISGDTYTLKVTNQANGGYIENAGSFKAVLSADGNTLTISESKDRAPSDGTYTKQP
jgi:hypothetical protein